MQRNGWYLDLSNEDYHSGEGLSASDIKRLLRSPAHYKYTPPKEPTPAMVQGTAFHTITLQPELFEKEFAVMPQGLNRVKKEGKEFAASAEAYGKTVISYDAYQQIKGMRDAIHEHPYIQQILQVGHAEVSGYWHDLAYPHILCKIRPDWLATDRQIILDLKSTTDAREHAFTRTAENMKYGVQAAYYRYGAKVLTGKDHIFAFATVEVDPPHGVIYYEADAAMIEDGESQIGEALRIYSECLEADKWHCYTTGVVPLGPPRWKNRGGSDNHIFE